AGKALPEAELLLRAASNRDPEVVKLFLTRGADINSTDDLGRTPLFFAARFSAPEAIKALIAAGADVNTCDKYGFSALMAAAEMSISPETVKILVDAGARIDCVDSEQGRTALDFALENENLKDTEVISLLRP
ncbi:MAG TPA: ankyrin repeat domain-containing protein, partial [Candidatus Rifleibacterium sp.]|nr:ankyrin repeat domain-containing protein [Candidatus Rifleibacterium sp.]